MRVVNQYIGVEGGLLGDFTYRTHAESYPEYCELSVDPGQWEGTTRQRFIQILASVEPREQARILRGVLARFPPDAANQPETRRGLKVELDRMIGRLEQGPVPSAGGAHLVESVRDALTDAEILLREKGPANAVDRVHTALHDYLKHACGRAGATVRPDASIGALLRLLRQHDTSLAVQGEHSLPDARLRNLCRKGTFYGPVAPGSLRRALRTYPEHSAESFLAVPGL